MECKKEENLVRCNCTCEPCARKGVCCECIVYHKDKGQLPACLFPDDAERTWDRSIAKFIEVHRKQC